MYPFINYKKGTFLLKNRLNSNFDYNYYFTYFKRKLIPTTTMSTIKQQSQLYTLAVVFFFWGFVAASNGGTFNTARFWSIFSISKPIFCALL